jgi:hypothetical protein
MVLTPPSSTESAVDCCNGVTTSSTMRLLQTAATAFFTTASSSSPQQLAALPRRRAIVASSFLPLALLLVVNPARGISTTDGVAASCNATPTLATMDDYDVEYPGTSVRRLQAVQARVATLAANGSLINHPWPDVRRQLLWAGPMHHREWDIPVIHSTIIIM